MKFRCKKTEPQSSKLKGKGIKIIIPFNIVDIWARQEVPLGLKLSGHTDTLTEANIPLVEIYERGEVQNELRYSNDLDNFHM